METAVAALQYHLARESFTVTMPDASGNPYDTEAVHYHTFSAGIENVWEKVWLFDSVHLRGGAIYVAETDLGSASAADTETRYKMPSYHEGITPTVGFGVSKDFFTLDVSLLPGSWGSVFVGPPVGLATVTIKF
jgi:hypothetical protein